VESEAPSPPARIVRIDAAGAFDARSAHEEPVALLVEVAPPHHPRLIAIGKPHEIDAHPAAARAQRTDLTGSILIPPLVNAHTHLDLTLIGPQPLPPSRRFIDWVGMVRDRRPTDPETIREAVEAGIRLSLAGGVAAVGDIAGAPGGRIATAAFDALAASPLLGVTYLEFFARGAREQTTLDALDQLIPPEPTVRVRPGLQPHAPTTVSRRAFRHAIDIALRHDLPLATHLAETPEEREFISTGAGPQRDLFESLGLWTDDILDDVGPRAALAHHPVAYMQDLLEQATILCAHVNDATDEAIEILARTKTPVVYCPRASAYFHAHAHFEAHRYRDMLSAGVPVCLGTDSIINLPAGSDCPHAGRISTLDEMRFLHTRDRTDPTELLRMATTTGAAALKLDPALFILTEGPIAGLVGIPIDDTPPTLASALLSHANPTRVL